MRYIRVSLIRLHQSNFVDIGNAVTYETNCQQLNTMPLRPIRKEKFCQIVMLLSFENKSVLTVYSNLLPLFLRDSCKTTASALTPVTPGDSVRLRSRQSQLTPAHPLNWHGIDFSYPLELDMSSILDRTGRWKDRRTDGVGRRMGREMYGTVNAARVSGTTASAADRVHVGFSDCSVSRSRIMASISDD